MDIGLNLTKMGDKKETRKDVANNKRTKTKRSQNKPDAMGIQSVQGTRTYQS